MNKQKLPNLIPILILTLITIVMWIGFDIYRAVNAPVTLTVTQSVSNPLTPSLDKATITQLESRSLLNDSQIPSSIISSSPIPTVTPKIVATPVASSSASPIPSPSTATVSATP